MKAKIYVIRSPQTDDIYYGCTTQKLLCSRFACHKQDYKNKRRNLSSFQILKYDDSYIELVEEFDYETKEQLKERESHWIRNNPCVNKQIPDRTYEEWCQDNKHHLAEKKREYRKTERQIKYNKEYYQKRKEQKKISNIV